MICDCCGKNFRKSKHKSTYTIIDGSLEEHYCSTDCAAKQLGIERIADKKCKACGKNLNEQTFKVCVDSYGEFFCCAACALKDNWVDKDGENSESVRDSE